MIEVEHVTKTYGAFTAVDDVSFTARQGRVTGFLGPNGAGKSTTMRIMVGLTPPSRGRVTIGGHQYSDIPNPGRHVGVLLDASAQHAGRTGREILAIGAATMGLPAKRVDEMLELVSSDAGGGKAPGAQLLPRHAAAARHRATPCSATRACSSSTSRPTASTPPASTGCAGCSATTPPRRDGAPSSHLLHEVEMIADDMILIGKGRIVAQGTKAELLQTSGTVVRAVEGEAMRDRIAEAGLRITSADEAGIRVDAEPVEVGAVAARHGLTLIELSPA